MMIGSVNPCVASSCWRSRPLMPGSRTSHTRHPARPPFCVARNSSPVGYASVGLPVEAYPTGEEFLATQNGGRAGCLVCDVRLPGMSGLDLQQELATHGFTLPIIMITAYADVSI